ncbi:MAG: hypothetical protein E7017_06520 [Alphaproteobacteria bacterium]|nr:hypothetical protein [Alphaproteobacteria bacterium]
MNQEILTKVFKYMSTHGLATFIDMYNAISVKGFKSGSLDCESSKLEGKDGDYIGFQSISLTEGSNRELQLRSIVDNRQVLDERINLSDCFPGKQIVIMTGGDSLYGLAPVLNDKLDLLEYIRFLRDYYQSVPDEDRWPMGYHVDQMESLAIWLYKNNPQEKVQSLVDEIEEKLKN